MSKKTSLFIAYFLFIALIPCSNAFSSCTRDSDCDYSQYCFTGGMNENVCSSCNHPDNTYSWSWVTNGQRQGTGINSCQWKIQCGNKPDFQNGTWASNDEYSTGYGSAVSANNGQCTYNPQNIICNAGYYRNNDTCKKCPDTHPNSANRSTSQNSCYKQCAPTVTIANGKKTNTNLDNKAYYSNECTYETECNDNYYTNNGACTQCPNGYPSSATNNNSSINQCYKECTTDSIDGGTVYYANDSTAFYGSSCTNVDHIKCNAGYYKNGNECTRCPYGSTSEPDAKAKTECYFSSGTQIHDLHGPYNIPTKLFLVQ